MKKLLAILVTVSMLAACLCGCLPIANGNSASITVEETVIYHENDIVITVTGLERSWGQRELKLLIENNSDEDIYVCGEYFAVNGISIYSYLTVTVAANKKANTSIWLDSTEFADAGIEQIASISGYDVHIYDDDSYDYNTGTYDTLDQFSFTVETAAAADHVQQIDESGEVIYQESGITVIAREFTNSFWESGVELLIKNESDQNLNVVAVNLSVNDYMVNGWLDEYVCKGTVRYCVIGLFSEDLKENGIDEIEKIAFSMQFLDAETYDVIWESDEMEITVDKE